MSHNHHINHNEFNRKFKFGIVLNSIFIIVEIIFGLTYNSLALIADAGHNLSDVLGLMIAWIANYLILKKPTKNFTYGFKRTSILAAMLNALLLIFALGIILWEAIERIKSTEIVDGNIVIIVAGIGVIINGITARLFLEGKDQDLNIKGAYLHMLTDAIISAGVVISGLLIMLTDFYWLDSVISILIVIIIFNGTWKLFKESMILSIDGVPGNINYENVRKFLLDKFEIDSLHHLHIWALSTSETALTVHVIPNANSNSNYDKLIKDINEGLLFEFGINHTTIQLENLNCKKKC
ncbi:MAG: cation transporter [Ignavibacteriae bacterium]|nr:cation transporter [Ignavibacteriota bacterium]